jgi:anti-sigma factor RsiW
MKPDLHERSRELLALRLYGELDLDERGELEHHLEACAACRAFAGELDRGLGRLVATPVSGDLPPGWGERLRAATSLGRRRPVASRWFGLGAAAGLAAGLALAWGLATLRPADSSGRSTLVASNGASSPPTQLDSSGAPPRARDGGELASLGRYLRR